MLYRPAVHPSAFQFAIAVLVRVVECEVASCPPTHVLGASTCIMLTYSSKTYDMGRFFIAMCMLPALLPAVSRYVFAMTDFSMSRLYWKPESADDLETRQSVLSTITSSVVIVLQTRSLFSTQCDRVKNVIAASMKWSCAPEIAENRIIPYDPGTVFTIAFGDTESCERLIRWSIMG